MMSLKLCLSCLLTLAIFLQVANANPALCGDRSTRGKSMPARIVLDKSYVELGPNQTIEIKAQVVDANDRQIPNARIRWRIAEGDKNLIVLRPVNQAETDVLITARDRVTEIASITIHAESGIVSRDLIIQLQDQTPAEIVFPDGNKVDLPIQGHKTIRAYVLNSEGNRLRDGDINWSLADPDQEAFVLVGANTSKAGVNSVDITWLGGKADLKIPSEVKLVARSGRNARAIVTINYKAPTPEVVKLSTDAKPITILPGEITSVDITVRGDDERLLKDVELEAEIADVNARKYLLVTTNKQTVTVIALAGDEKSSPPPLLRTALVISTKNKSKMLTVPLVYLRESASINWTILPPNIVGDNYGRTIRDDYYCIEVTIQNNSGSDLALAGLHFVSDDGSKADRPDTSYTTVHGSLARRKLTHPRTMVLSIIDATGSLMTGFNPFFHNLNHAKNFSQGIDIISNPLAKGLEKAWKDPYPDELARFEQDVLHDDKIIPNNGILKSKIFVPKRDVFPRDDQKKERGDLDAARKALGKLEVLGYKFQKGTAQSVGSSK